jgi:hypothetical protein
MDTVLRADECQRMDLLLVAAAYLYAVSMDSGGRQKALEHMACTARIQVILHAGIFFVPTAAAVTVVGTTDGLAGVSLAAARVAGYSNSPGVVTVAVYVHFGTGTGTANLLCCWSADTYVIALGVFVIAGR